MAGVQGGMRRSLPRQVIQAEAGWAVRGKRGRQRGSGQDQGHAGVAQHVCQPWQGPGKIERHIGGTSLENAQQADEQLYGTIQVNAH